MYGSTVNNDKVKVFKVGQTPRLRSKDLVPEERNTLIKYKTLLIKHFKVMAKAYM